MATKPSASEMPGRTCLSFELRGPWAHFRRIEGNIVKQTYRVIPRTTVSGLVAAVLGIERDGYYETFQPGNTAIAVEVQEPLRTLNLPQNNLSTNHEAFRTARAGRSASIAFPDPSEPRQQFNYEVLVDPAYRVDLWSADDAFQERLRDTLEAGRSHYVPSLGLSEHLAQIEYMGEHEIQEDEDEAMTKVSSTVVDASEHIVPPEEGRLAMERSPAYMETVPTAEGGGRRTTGYLTHAYNPDGGPLEARGVETNLVDGRSVMFA